MLLSKLETLIHSGKLTIMGPSGVIAAASGQDAGGPEVVVRLRGPLTALKLALDPDRYLGEAYMDGSLSLERGTIHELLDLCGRNFGKFRYSPGYSAWVQRAKAAAGQLRGLSRRKARHNVAHHYDLSDHLYRLFLDTDLQYSCGYFSSPDAPLDAAQDAKKRHIAAKLLLRPGQQILDIGCGWGGLALALAQMADVRVLGITLSREQLRVARQRAHEFGLDDRVTFPAAGLPGRPGTFRPDRLGRDVRARWEAALWRLLPGCRKVART